MEQKNLSKVKSKTYNENEVGIRNIEFTAELEYEYKSLKELKKHSEIIAKVEVLNTKTIEYEDLPFTISQVKILDKKKGPIKKNEILQIIETGGVYSPEGKNGLVMDSVEYQLNGVSVLQKGEVQFLLLKKFEGPQVNEKTYIPLGAYQGKFKVKNNKVYQQAKLESEESEFVDFIEIPEEDFKEKIEDPNT
jgi:hypothetical protein